ncbi:MAG: hypothetical protein IT477_02175, partial [Rhodanobacteraceae bacterium]|nr:hypothetical protein [Rhodanobacteraceae bacterium]
VRTRASEIACVGRNTQGVKLISLPGDESLAGVVKVEGLNGNGHDEVDADVDPTSDAAAPA